MSAGERDDITGRELWVRVGRADAPRCVAQPQPSPRPRRHPAQTAPHAALPWRLPRSLLRRPPRPAAAASARTTRPCCWGRSAPRWSRAAQCIPAGGAAGGGISGVRSRKKSVSPLTQETTPHKCHPGTQAHRPVVRRRRLPVGGVLLEVPSRSGPEMGRRSVCCTALHRARALSLSRSLSALSHMHLAHAPCTCTSMRAVPLSQSQSPFQTAPHTSPGTPRCPSSEGSPPC